MERVEAIEYTRVYGRNRTWILHRRVCINQLCTKKENEKSFGVCLVPPLLPNNESYSYVILRDACGALHNICAIQESNGKNDFLQ